MKKEAKIKPFWYSDIWLFPKIITIITTLDENGRVNAAPYSHIMQYDVMPKNPRMIVGFRQSSHTFENIMKTGEFVINCCTADHLDDMMETARFWPEGVNELEHTGFTPIPSKKRSNRRASQNVRRLPSARSTRLFGSTRAAALSSARSRRWYSTRN